jgi:hypothetical protein
MADRAAETLERLRRNDPSETFVNIWLRNFTDDVALSEALQANDHVKYIYLDFKGLTNTNTNWDSLLRVLAMRENLKIVDMRDDDDNRGWERNSPERVAPFVLALQQNPKIYAVMFSGLQLSGDSMASFIDAATSDTILSIRECELEAPGGVVAVAAALQRNKNIWRLILKRLDDKYLIPILNSLTSNTSLKELLVSCSGGSLEFSFAVKNLLESNMTIQRFEVYHDGDIHVDTFRSIAESLIQSSGVTAVEFERSNFDSHEKVLIFNGILEAKPNLQSLTLSTCTVYEDGKKEFRAAILSLLQPHSMLRNLKLKNDHGVLELSQYGFDTSGNFDPLLAAVESSPLESFSIGPIDSRKSCQALIASIPRMQVQTLELYLHQNLQDLKVDLLQAIERNASLRTVVAKNCYNSYDHRDLFDDHDKMKLTSYSVRNEFLGQLIENPASVRRAAWPEYLAVAQTAGPDTVIGILRVLANQPVGWYEGV